MGGRDEYLCYTDGACKAAHDGAGGWGFHIRPPKGAAIERYGTATRTLAKVMEYRAVAEALDALPEGVKATVFSDNQSLVENLEKHLATWTARGFAKVDPLILLDVQRIAAAIATRRLEVQWQWVRAHNGNAGNERADDLAARGAREAKQALKTR